MAKRAFQTLGGLALISLLAGGAAPRLAQAQHAQANATITIGISIPTLQYPNLPEGIEYGVKVAVAEANAANLVPGVTFAVNAKDDTINGKNDPVKDASNARGFISDPTVIGEVGPLNSGAAEGSIAVYNNAQMVQISPANTLLDLTQPKYRAKFEPRTAAGHGPITYFRTIAPDTIQGGGDALFAYQKLKVRSIYVVDNQDSYGVGLANDFEYSAKGLGMKDFGHAELDPTQPKMGADAVAANIASQTGGKVNMVFFGGEFGPTGGATFLADALKAHGVNTIFMGGDGIYDPNFISQSSNGGVLTAYASKGGPDVATSKGANAFVATEQKMFKFSYSTYDVFSYDAANALIEAYAAAVKAGQIKVGQKQTQTTRGQIALWVAKSNFKGITGQISFDANGDIKAPLFSVYKVTGTGKSAHWQFVQYDPIPKIHL
jgi:branched-chain amino acid transport system substrate-binding protein